MSAFLRTLGRFNRWFISRPTLAAIIALNVAHDGLHFGWFLTVVLTWLVYCFVSDGDRLRSNINVTVAPSAATDALYRVAKPSGGVRL